MHRRGVFRNNAPQCTEFYTILIFIIHCYILRFTTFCTFYQWRVKIPKTRSFERHLIKLFVIGSRAIHLQLIVEVTQINPFFNIVVINLPNGDYRVYIVVLHRLPQLTQLFMLFYQSLGCYVWSNCTVKFFPSQTFSSECFKDNHAT